jgi:hypothetical protein
VRVAVHLTVQRDVVESDLGHGARTIPRDGRHHRSAEGDGRFSVRIDDDDGSSTEHEVSVSAEDLKRLGAGRTPDSFVRACMKFLLEREPKEQILHSFDVSVIGSYFPGFEQAIVEG